MEAGGLGYVQKVRMNPYDKCGACGQSCVSKFDSDLSHKTFLKNSWSSVPMVC
jgi:hypothetical protein